MVCHLGKSGNAIHMMKNTISRPNYIIKSLTKLEKTFIIIVTLDLESAW